MSYRTFSDIPPLTPLPGYHVSVGFNFLEKQIKAWQEEYSGGLDLSPDFQRGHVWTEGQQIAFVEYALRGGLKNSGSRLLFNCMDWDDGGNEPIVIVDGLQRLTAVRRFLNNEIPAFGRLHDDYEGPLTTMGPRFDVHINNLPTREDVLRWYLELNAGGVVHSPEEIARVSDLLEAEMSPALKP